MKRIFNYRAAAVLIAGLYIFMLQPVRAQSGVVEFMEHNWITYMREPGYIMIIGPSVRMYF